MRNRELLLAAPFALGAVILLVVVVVEPERPRSGERSLTWERESRVTDLGGERGRFGVPTDEALASVADASSSSGTAPDSVAIGDGRGTRGRTGGVAEVGAGGGVDPEAEARRRAGTAWIRRPGGSHLYEGVLRRGGVPLELGQAADVSSKARQVERANDVAEKRGSVLGQIVSVDATAITGWAYDWNDLATVANVDVYVDNKLVATVPASAQRPNFDPANPANPINTRAWVVPAPALLADGDKHWVSAVGYRPGSDAKRELERSPWTFGGVHWPRGEIVFVSERMVYGWVRDPDALDQPMKVSVQVDGKLLGETTTKGRGHNRAVFDEARALSPTKKTVVALDGLSGPEDPGLGAAIAAKLQSLKATRLYLDFWPLASATDAVPHDVFEFSVAAADGKIVLLAGQERAGIKLYEIPADNQAFVFNSPQPIVGTWLQVKLRSSADGAIEREARRSPFQLAQDTNQPPRGQLLLFTGNQISGYALDPDALPGPISVEVTIDGVSVGRVTADKAFPQEYNHYQLPDPNHGFAFTIPEKYLDGKTHTIQMFAVNHPAGVNPELRNSPAPFVGSRNIRPYGWLDVADATRISGWAYDHEAGSSPVSVEIWVDGALYKTVTANLDRPELVPLAFPDPAHGYTCPPPPLDDGKHHTIRAFALDVPDGPKQELWGSPKEINAQKPYIGLNPYDAPNGLAVAEVTSGAPASVAGVAVGDVIRAFDDRSEKVDRAAFIAWVQAREVGEKMTLRLFRDPSLGAPPEPNPAVPPGTPLAANERLVVVTVGSR